jgi:bifunctional non-homologous end joining protein LigD
MLKLEHCKPVNAEAVPTDLIGSTKVKYDGYRRRIVRDGKDVRLLSKSGLDWAGRFPWSRR